MNRKNQIIPNDNYDIVIGPVANDRTIPVISLYFALPKNTISSTCKNNLLYKSIIVSDELVNEFPD